MPSFNPESWGGRNTNKDYELYMEGATATSRPISLSGSHAVTSPGQNLTDVVTERYVKKVNGRLVERERVIRPAEELSLTFTLLFGSALETPALVRARRGAACRTTFYAVKLCADPQESHAYIWPEAIMNPPTRVNDAIQIEDTSMADWQTEMRIEEEILIKELGAFEGVAEQNADPYYDVAFFEVECDDCDSTTMYSSLIAVGGDGTAAMVVDLTTDRFATVTQPSTQPAPAGSVATSVTVNGELEVLVGFSDLAKDQYGETTGPASGGTIFSADGGDNFTLDSNITVPIAAVGRFNGEWYAAGGADDSPAYLATSPDGITWVPTSNMASLSATAAITDVAVDTMTGKMYVVTQDGKLWVGSNSAGSIIFSELTAVPGSPTKLLSVAVLGEDHVAIGGSSGYYAESVDGGTTFTQPTVSGSGNVLGIAGLTYRSLVGNATNLYGRDVLSDYVFSSIPATNGNTIGGNVTGITQASGQWNIFAAVTDAGEPFIVRDYSPFSE